MEEKVDSFVLFNCEEQFYISCDQKIGFSIGIGNLIDDVSLGDHVSIVLCWLQQFCTGGALIRLAFSPRGFCCKPTKGPCFDRNQPLHSVDLVDEKKPPSSNQQQTSMEK
ncbi:hypothetical protein T03_13208 [Trichinella britovi]|uniref:Uncharacterized protein n=1 Tax=Trichinella britovi TaxID=45882 RepID=A0A0V1CW22_TRIBR|nr:hypothetical protein T03_13208 [Trichinella britovi]